MQEKLSLDNELLKPIKTRLEQSIDVLTKNAIEIDEENNIVVKNMNEQQSLFRKGRE